MNTYRYFLPSGVVLPYVVCMLSGVVSFVCGDLLGVGDDLTIVLVSRRLCVFHRLEEVRIVEIKRSEQVCVHLDVSCLYRSVLIEGITFTFFLSGDNLRHFFPKILFKEFEQDIIAEVIQLL